MKNIKLYFLYACAFLMVLSTSCGEEDLDEVLPRASIAPAAVASADAVEKLLVGVYDRMQQGGAGTNLYYLSFLTEDLSADNLAYRATFFQHGEIDDNAILASNVLVQRYYSGPFETIFIANQLLAILEGVDAAAFTGSANRKAEVEGETKYLRALAYFRLRSLFGGVAVKTVNSNDPVPRNTQEEVDAQIIADLNDAIGLAPDFTTRFQASKDAARALLARLSMMRGEYGVAQAQADAVIANNSFAIASDYASIFAPGSNGGNTQEMIFQVTNTLNDGTFHGFFLTDATQPFGNGGRLELPADPDLVAAYEAGDERFAASIAPARPGFDQAIKFGSGLNGDDPFPISRISEMYLISAEASAEEANDPAAGIAQLNAVRTQRGLAALATPATLDEFVDAVLAERRVELAFEGVRWQDLIRRGRAIATLPNVTSATQLLYPIPQRELDNNPLIDQNDGY